MTTTDPKLTTADAAEQLSVAEITIQRWAAKGRFPGAVNFRGTTGWRIPQSSVDALFRGRRKTQREPSKLAKSQQREAS